MANQKIIIALDIGKSTTKLLGRLYNDGKIVKATNKSDDIKVTLATKCDELFEEDVDVESGSYLTEVDGNKYLVGAQATTESEGSSKLNYIHRICGLTALTKHMEPGVLCEVYMYLASPLNQLKSKKYIQEYKDFFKKDDNTPMIVRVNRKDYKFILKEIAIKPEGSGALKSATDKFRNREVALIDIGGKNIGVTLYDNCKAVVSNRFQMEIGNKRLEEIIEDAIITYGDSADTPSINEVTKAIRNGYLTSFGKVDEKSKGYITDAKNKFFKEILSTLTKKGIKPDRVESLLFIGGTSQNIIDQIGTMPNAEYLPNAQWEAVQGLYLFALAAFKGEM